MIENEGRASLRPPARFVTTLILLIGGFIPAEHIKRSIAHKHSRNSNDFIPFGMQFDKAWHLKLCTGRTSEQH